MADNVEKRVVQMEFDNSKFDKNIKKSSNTLDEFKKKLQFKDVSKGMDEVAKKFSALDAITFSVINNITNRIVNLGIQLFKSLSIDNIATGWTKFGQKATATATIMAQSVKVAGKELTNYAEKTAAVNEQLERLNWFTDETSYNFTDMIDNIGKFTAAGQDLDTAVKAMEGIATWAALSGQNATTASRAMYQLAQTLGKGYVQLQDWRSIQNANMDTQEFRQTVLETAVALGELTKQGNEFVSKTGKKINATNFVDTLSEKWFTSDVLIKTLGKYSAAVDQIYEIASREDLTTSQVMEKYGDTLDEFGVKAFKAAQECRTLEDALNSIKDAVSTGWTNTFDLIIGKYEEAKEVWSDLADSLYEAFVESNNFRNSILKVWSALEGRADLFGEHGSANQGAFWNLYDAIIAVKDAVKSAWDAVFPISVFKASDEIINNLGNNFKNLTKRLQEYTKKIKDTISNNKTLQGVLKGIAAIIKIIAGVIEGIRYTLDPIITLAKGIIEDILIRLGFLGDHLSKLETSASRIEKIAKLLGSAIESVLNILDIRGNLNRFYDFMDSIFNMTFNGKSVVDDLVTFLSNLGEAIREFKIDVENITKSDVLSPVAVFIEGIIEFAKGLYSLLASSIVIIGKVFNFMGQLMQIIADLFTGKLWANMNTAAKIAIIAGGVIAVLALAFIAIYNGIYSIASTINPLGYAVTNLTDSLYAFAFSNQLKAISDLLNTIAKAFLEVAIAMVLIASIPLENFIRAAITIGLLSVVFITLVGFVKKANNTLTTTVKAVTNYEGGLTKVKNAFEEVKETLLEKWNLESIGYAIWALGLAMMEIGIAFQLIGNLNWEEWGRAMIAMGSFFALLISFIVVVNSSSKGTSEIDNKGIKRIGKSLIAFAISFRVIASAMETLGNMKATKMWQGFAGFAAMVGIIMAAAILIDTFIKATTKTAIVPKDAKVVNNQNQSIVSIMLSLTATVGILGLLAMALGNLDDDILGKGLMSIASIIMLLVAFVASLKFLPKDNKVVNSTSTLLLALSLMMINFAVSMAIMQKVPWQNILIAVLSFSEILIALGVLVKLSKSAFNGTKKLTSMLSLMLGIAAMMLSFGIAMKLVGNMPWQNIVSSMGSILLIIASMVLMTKLLSNPMDSVALLALSSSLLILGAAIIVMAEGFKRLEGVTWNNIFKGLVLVIGGLAALAIVAVITASVTPIILALSASMFLLGAGLLMAASSLTFLANDMVPAAEAITQNADVIMQAMSVLATGISNALTDALFTAVVGLNEMIPQLTELLTNFLNGIFSTLTAVGPGLIDLITTLIVATLNSIRDQIYSISAALIDILVGILQAVADKMDSIVEVLVNLTVELLKALATHLVPRMGEIMMYVMQIIIGILEAIVDYVVPLAKTLGKLIVTIIAAAIKIAIALLGSLSQLILILITELILIPVELLDGLTNVIFAAMKTILINLVKILNKALAFVGELVPVMIASGVSAFIGGLIKGIVDIMDAYGLDWLADMLGLRKAATSMLDAADAMTDMLGDGINEVIAAADDAFNNIANTVSWGADKVDNALSGALNIIGDSLDDIGEIFDDAWDVGSNIIDGLTGGITDNSDKPADAASDATQDAIDASKDTAKVHSPSKVFAEIGKFLMLGLAKGIDDTSNEAINSVTDSVSTAIAAANEIVNNMDDELVIRPVMDLSNVTEGTESIASLMSSISGRSVSISGNLAGSTANEINRARNQNASAQTVSSINNEGDVYNTTFNVTTNDPEELARQTDVILQRQRAMAQMAKGGAK